jgi:hypothetical protein
MTIQRLENVGIVVEDLAAATAFFVELGLTVLGKGPVEGDWVDRVVGLEGVRVDVAMLETVDGHGRLELMKFHAPPARGGDGHARRTPWASAVSHSQSTTSTPLSPGCKPVARSSSARWSATRTAIASATSAARRGFSSCLRSRSAESSGRRQASRRRQWSSGAGSLSGTARVSAAAACDTATGNGGVMDSRHTSCAGVMAQGRASAPAAGPATC